MNFKIKIFLISFFLIASHQTFVFCADTVISTALLTRASLVDITAIATNVTPLNNTAAVIDEKTGKLVIGRRAKIGVAERSGTGIILSADGFIITNVHTIKGFNHIIVKLHDGTTYSAKIVDAQGRYDLALLKVESPQPLSPIPFADSDSLTLGQEIFNIGSSELLNGTLSGGEIISIGSTPNSPTSKETSVEFIKLNINLYKGDSGGPILDRQGQLVGMVMGKIHNTDRDAVAVASNKIKNLYQRFTK